MQSDKILTNPCYQTECKVWLPTRLHCEVLRTRGTFLDFVTKRGLIPIEMKCDEGHEMKFGESRGKFGLGQFRCRLKHKDGKDREVSRTKGTWFENCHFYPEKALFITLLFAIDCEFERALFELKMFDANTSRSTVSDWYTYSREVLVEWMLDEQDQNGMLGGINVCVEINDTKFGTRKGNVGRLREGTYIFAMIERGTGTKRYRLEICEDNKRGALLPLIQKHVLPGTTIMSESWLLYQQLDDSGDYDFTVNNSENLVGEETGAHTQRIDSSWNQLKQRLRSRCVKKDHLADHLVEYLFRMKCVYENLEPFETLLLAIQRSYPIRTEMAKV